METEAYLKLMLITVGLMAIAFAAMAIRILIKKKGKFVNLHLGGNKEMKKKGITCATSTMKRDELTYKAIKI